jgi:hypothetical protein
MTSTVAVSGTPLDWQHIHAAKREVLYFERDAGIRAGMNGNGIAETLIFSFLF